MTAAVVRSIMLAVLLHIFLIPCGVQGLVPEDGASLLSAAFKLPWQDELCCDSPLLLLSVEGSATHAAETNLSKSNLPHRPHCSFRNSTRESEPNKFSGGTCLDIQCRINESWANLICELRPHSQPSGAQSAGRTAVSLQRLFERNNTEVSDTASINPVVCEGKDSVVCSLSVDPATDFVTIVTVNISNAVAPPVLLRCPALPVKPSPPVGLSHFQTSKAELFVHWKDQSDFNSGPLRYEVQYSSRTTYPTRQVVSVSDQPRVSLHLKPYMKYTIQVRCSSLEEPPLWSNWSKPHFIYLGEVSYIPEQVVAGTGENVSVYCVFNDRSVNASTAVWKLNDKELDRSLSHTVNEWVSQVTFRASETGIYDKLQCKKNFSIPYSQIYVQGGFIDINCMTNGDNAMECKWTNKEEHTLTLFYEWANLRCDVMKKSSSKDVFKNKSFCKAVKSSDKFCTISPLKATYCYKLWMGLCGKNTSSTVCTIQSKHIYISPFDHVKPHQPTNVMATSSGVLKVTWVRPKLPVQSLQFQYRFRSPDTEIWRVQGPLQSHWAEVMVPDMCKVYIVQVRCMLKSGKGYWSDWSDSVRSIPENSRVPERGPDFWRIRYDAPVKNSSNITVIFESSETFPVFWNSYCVDGFIVQHRYSNGFVRRDTISQLSPYSFDWNQEHHTVTVEAFNSLGSSINNINMTLDKPSKCRCVKSFHVLLMNSTCVSLSWSLLDSSSVPQFMVVQWFPQSQQDFKDYVRSQNSWVRLPYTDLPVNIDGVFLFEEYIFHLYPVFSDGEGEPVIISASKGKPTAYGMLLSISLLCIFLFVTLFLSQKRINKVLWEDIPNPNECSWAKGLDFKKVESSDNLYQSLECSQAMPLLLPSENISKVVIIDKTTNKAQFQKPFVSPAHDPATASSTPLPVWMVPRVKHLMENDASLDGVPSLDIILDAFTTSSLCADELPPIDPPVDQHSGSSDRSAQSSVIYAKVHPTDEQPIHWDYKDGNSSSSSDKGIFINSDMLVSGTSELCELGSFQGAVINRPRHSSSNTMEDLCKTSKQGGEGKEVQEKDLYYLDIEHLSENDETKEEEQSGEKTKDELLGNAVLHRQVCPGVLHPLRDPELQPVSTRGSPSLYMPQCRTAPCTGTLSA